MPVGCGIGRFDAARHRVTEPRLCVAPTDDLAAAVREQPLLAAVANELDDQRAIVVAVPGAGVALDVNAVVPKPAIAGRPPREVRERVVVEERQVIVEQLGRELADVHAHSSVGVRAALVGSSGMARSSKTFRRSSIGVRELMSSRTFLRPLIFPTRIAPTSLSPRKKSRL